MTRHFHFVLLALLATLSVQPFARAQQQQDPKGRDLRFNPDKPARPAGAVPRGYALVVGVARYEKLDESKQLQFSESDAEAIYRVLISREGGAFPPENVKLLKGRDATLVNVRQALEEWLPSVAQASDRVVVYFAGHGFVQNGRGYLAPWDVDPDQLDKTSYSMNALGDVLANRVKANWKVLFTDACHSGKITPETTNETLEQQFSALPSSFLTLTATTEREQSFEDPNLANGFGFYTYFLVQAFRGYADHDPCDGRITADELIEYVRRNVREYARKRQLMQTPTARGDYEPEMLLGVAPGCLGDGANAPSMHGTAIVETNLDEVDVYVDGELRARISKDKPLTIPGLTPGLHEFQGVREGYEPDRKEVMIAPGQEATVTLRIRYARQIKKPAVALNEAGEKLLFTRRSSLSLMNLVPAERKQTENDLRRAAELFEKALREDSTYAVAAYHLGQVYHLLLDFDASVRYFRQASTIDPTHLGARIECAAAFIERGDPDEAVRELTEALRIEPSSDEAYSMLARAYWDKGAWALAIDNADKAIQLKASNAQAYLWRADARRQLAFKVTNDDMALPLYRQSRDDYREFVDLTNFSSGIGARLAFHFIGFGIGSRKHADRQMAYDGLRSSGFMGLCLTEHKIGNSLRAREYCQRALKHAPKDPIAYFLLGDINLHIYNARLDSNQTDARPLCDLLKSARASYTTMLKINADLEESKRAKDRLLQIDGMLVNPELGCRGA